MLRPRDLVLVTGHLNPPVQTAPAQELLQVETERYQMEVIARIPWKCRGGKCLQEEHRDVIRGNPGRQKCIVARKCKEVRGLQGLIKGE